MYYAVMQLGKLCFVPAVGCTYKVTGDTLQFVKVLAAALGTSLKILGRVLIATVEATVAVVVYRAVAYVVLVHHIHYAHDSLGVVCGIAVNLHIEDVTTAGEVVIRSLNLGLVACAALVVYRHVVTVGIIFAVGDTLDDTEQLAVAACKAARKALGRCCKDTVVMLILLREVICTVTHISDDAQA